MTPGVILGPSAIVGGRAALVISHILRGRLQHGLPLRRVLEEMGVPVADLAAAVAAAEALEDAGERWRLSRFPQTGNAATCGNRVVAPSKVMSTQQAANLLHLSERRIRQFAAAGDIPASLVGGRYRFDHDAVLAFVGARRSAA